MKVLSLSVLSLVFLLAGGCFLTTAPVFPSSLAEDMGDVFRYRTFVLKEETAVTTIYTREAGNRYHSVIVFFEGQSTGSERSMGLSEFRRFGFRGQDVIYLIQTTPLPASTDETQAQYLVSLVTLRADGLGVLALLDCEDPDTLALAARRGITLACERPSRFTPSVQGWHDGAALRAFFQEAMSTGILLWEDGANYSLFDAFSDSL